MSGHFMFTTICISGRVWPHKADITKIKNRLIRPHPAIYTDDVWILVWAYYCALESAPSCGLYWMWVDTGTCGKVLKSTQKHCNILSFFLKLISRSFTRCPWTKLNIVNEFRLAKILMVVIMTFHDNFNTRSKYKETGTRGHLRDCVCVVRRWWWNL